MTARAVCEELAQVEESRSQVRRLVGEEGGKAGRDQTEQDQLSVEPAVVCKLKHDETGYVSQIYPSGCSVEGGSRGQVNRLLL